MFKLIFTDLILRQTINSNSLYGLKSTQMNANAPNNSKKLY